MKHLSEKRKAFAEHYCSDCVGNAYQAAIAAGYSPATAVGHSHKLIKNKEVLKYIEYLNTAVAGAVMVEPVSSPSGASSSPVNSANISPRIASIADIQMFWTNILNDEDEPIKNRLKASELLAKSKGMFNNDW